MEIFVITKRDGKHFEVMEAFDTWGEAQISYKKLNAPYEGKRPFSPFGIWRIPMSTNTIKEMDFEPSSRRKLVDTPYCKICNHVFGSESQYAIIVEPYNSYVCLECASLIEQAYDKDM